MITFDEQRYYRHYYYAPDMLAPVAEDLGISLSGEALQTQRLAAGSICLIDTTWDDDPSAHGALLDFCASLNSEKPIAARPPELLPQLIDTVQALHQELTPEQARQFLSLGEQALSLRAQYIRRTDLHEYIALRKQEARCASYMISLVVPDAERAHIRYPEYAERSARILEAGNVFDSLQDHREDFKTGQIEIPPTMSNRLLLGIMTVREMRACRKLLGPDLFTEVWRWGIAIRRRQGAKLVY